MSISCRARNVIQILLLWAFFENLDYPLYGTPNTAVGPGQHLGPKWAYPVNNAGANISEY